MKSMKELGWIPDEKAPFQYDQALAERERQTSKRGCPDCGATVECRIFHDGLTFSAYSFRKGPQHAATCRSWDSR